MILDTTAQCLNGGYGWQEVMCKRCVAMCHYRTFPIVAPTGMRDWRRHTDKTAARDRADRRVAAYLSGPPLPARNTSW